MRATVDLDTKINLYNGKHTPQDDEASPGHTSATPIIVPLVTSQTQLDHAPRVTSQTTMDADSDSTTMNETPGTSIYHVSEVTSRTRL